MNKIMEIIHCHKKEAHLNTIEKFHIHTEFAKNNHLNDPQTVLPNAIFETLIQIRLTDHNTQLLPNPKPLTRLETFLSTPIERTRNITTDCLPPLEPQAAHN